MKAMYKINEYLTIEIEADATKELVDELTKVEELQTESCGLCKSDNVFLRAKNVKGNMFYALECRDCHGLLNYGVSNDKKPHIYKKRVEVDGDGKTLKVDDKPVFLGKNKNGWVKWNPVTKKAE